MLTDVDGNPITEGEPVTPEHPPGADLHLGGQAWAYPALEPLLVPITHAPTPHPGNPKRGDVQSVMESMRLNGIYRPIYYDQTTGHTLGGHTTTEAITALGATRLPVLGIQPDTLTALRILEADNATAEAGTYDVHAQIALLERVLAEQGDLTGTGRSLDFLTELAATLDALTPGRTDPDDVPPLPTATPVSVEGDVWTLGQHHLVVGDSTTTTAWDALLDGDGPVACIWTDPPYGVEIVGGSHAVDAAVRRKQGKPTIQNDGEAGIPALLAAVFDEALPRTLPGAAWYVASPAGPIHLAFASALAERGILRQGLVWDKGTMVMGRSDYHYAHEPLLYGRTPSGGNGRFGRMGGKGWYGPNNETSIIQVPRPTRSTEHPTMKPVELVARCLRNSTRPGALVADPFAGSGSTLIACQQEGRTARLIELDPRYADVICLRYQEHTGVMPTRNGEPHSFL